MFPDPIRWMLHPRAARVVAWLAVLVFGLVVPAHLGGSDHHHHHRHHAHAHDAPAFDGEIDSACDPHAHHTDDPHHRGHDHQLLIPGKSGPHGAKVVASAIAAVADLESAATPCAWLRPSPQRDPGRIDRAPALPRGPPASTSLVV